MHFLVFQVESTQNGAVDYVIVRREISGFHNALQKVSVQHIVLSFSIMSLLDKKCGVNGQFVLFIIPNQGIFYKMRIYLIVLLCQYLTEAML